MIGKNKLVQQKSRPTSSTTRDWSKAGHKNLILTTSLKAGGHLQKKDERRQDGTILTRNLPPFGDWFQTCYLYLLYNQIFKKCLVSTHPVGHKAILLTVFCPSNVICHLAWWWYTINTVYIISIALID